MNSPLQGLEGQRQAENEYFLARLLHSADGEVNSPLQLSMQPEGLTRPEPAEGGSGQQGVDEAVDDFLQGHAPRLALPDAVAEMSEAMGEERGSACYAGDGETGGAGRDGASGEIRDEDTDDQAIDKPHPEELGHGDWTTGKHGQHPHGSL